MQFSLPAHPVASIGSSTATMMSATVISRRGARVAAARAAGRFDQLVAAQLAEQLLEVGQRNLLALADRGQRHRALLAQGQIDHRGDGETAFGGESHNWGTANT